MVIYEAGASVDTSEAAHAASGDAEAAETQQEGLGNAAAAAEPHRPDHSMDVDVVGLYKPEICIAVEGESTATEYENLEPHSYLPEGGVNCHPHEVAVTFSAAM